MARKIPFREKGGSSMEVIEHWDVLLAYLMVSREGIDITCHNANSFVRDLVADRTLRAEFAPETSIVKISKYCIFAFP